MLIAYYPFPLIAYVEDDQYKSIETVIDLDVNEI